MAQEDSGNGVRGCVYLWLGLEALPGEGEVGHLFLGRGHGGQTGAVVVGEGLGLDFGRADVVCWDADGLVVVLRVGVGLGAGVGWRDTRQGWEVAIVMEFVKR